MSLHRRGVDRHLLRRTTRRCQGMEDVLPYAFGSPADEAIVESFARAIDGRGVDSATSGLQHMDDPADDVAIIDPWFAARIARKMRFKACELFPAQPEIIPIHQ